MSVYAPRECTETVSRRCRSHTGFDDDSDYDEPGATPKRVRTPNTRPVTPLPEPIIDRDFLDRDYDTPYTVGRFPLKPSEGPVPASKPAEARHTTRRDDLKACDGNGKPNLPLEVEVETERHGEEFTISFLAKIRGGGPYVLFWSRRRPEFWPKT